MSRDVDLVRISIRAVGRAGRESVVKLAELYALL